MARTRAATGNSKPRQVEATVDAVVKKAVPAAKKKATQAKKAVASATKTTANTSKPRAKKTATGRVEKKPAAKKPAAKATKAAPAKKAAPASAKKATTKKPATTPKAKATPKAKTPSKAAPKAKSEEKKEDVAAKPADEQTIVEKVVETGKGLLMKAEGALTGSSGKKAAGTRKLNAATGSAKKAKA